MMKRLVSLTGLHYIINTINNLLNKYRAYEFRASHIEFELANSLLRRSLDLVHKGNNSPALRPEIVD
jgi:hypothetical protein